MTTECWHDLETISLPKKNGNKDSRRVRTTGGGQLRHFTLCGLFIRTAAPLVFPGQSVVFGAKMTDAISKIDVRRLKVGDLLLKILVYCPFLGLVYLVLGRA